jgi:hypothetical protein
MPSPGPHHPARTATAVALLAALALGAGAAHGGDVKFFDDGMVALWARANLIPEAPVLLLHGGSPVDDPGTSGADAFDGVEIFDHVPGTDDFPLAWVDLIANCFFRPSYQKADGTSAQLGTSVVGCPSFRSAEGALRYIPSVGLAAATTGLPPAERIAIALGASFGAQAEVTSERRYPDPPLGSTLARLHVGLHALLPIELDASALGSDALRFLTLSSMFSSETVYDANVLVWEDPEGQVRALRLDAATPRGTHLLPAATALGCWFELVKEPGSSWFPDSPSLRVEIESCGDGGPALGLQAFLAETLQPNDDSLTVWIEWLDAPNPLPADASVSLDVAITAFPPGDVAIPTLPALGRIVLALASGLAARTAGRRTRSSRIVSRWPYRRTRAGKSGE